MDHVLYVKGDDGKFGTAANRQAGAGCDVQWPEAGAGEQRGAERDRCGAWGSLRLFSPDAATRLHAAEAVFESHDVAALPTLDKALAKETDPAVKTRMEQAQAAALLFANDAPIPQRLAAVATLRARGDLESRSLLDGLSNQPPQVAAAAHAAVASIDHVLQLWSILESVYYGISLGSVLLLAAAGLAITFGVMGVINMAHGEMVMLGAYTTYVVQQVMHQIAPSLYEANLLFAVPLAFLVIGHRRHRHRAQPDPLALRASAGDAVGHLGSVAGFAAGGAHAFRCP